MTEIEDITTELAKLDIPEADAHRMAHDIIAMSQRSDPTRNLPIIETVRRLVHDQLNGTDYSTPDMEITESASGWITTVTYRPLPVESDPSTGR